MLERPAFKPHLHVEVVPGEGLVLLSETDQHVLTGPLFALVAPHLDGRRSPDAVAVTLAGQVGPAEVRQALTDLEHQGVLTEGSPQPEDDQSAFWASQGVDARRARQRLLTDAVSVHAVGVVAVEAFQETLRTAGVRVRPDGTRTVVATDDYLHSDLAAYNRAALEGGRAWMLVKPVGRELWIGPVFEPDRTGCWQCLADRARENRQVEIFVRERTTRAGPVPIPRASTPASRQLAWSLAACAVAGWIVRGEAPDLEGTVLVLDVRSGQTRTHALVRRPQCPACGDPVDPPEDGEARPITLGAGRKTFTLDGGHRVRSPEATLQRYEHLVSPITGVVARLERAAPVGGVLHTYVAGSNVAIPPRSLRALRTGLRSRSGGKGITDLQARASALCEGLERHSGIFRGDEPRRRARMRDLGEAGIHPNACLQFSERQYQERTAWNRRCSPKHMVPLPFDEDAVVSWTPVWSLTRRETRFLPTAFCFYRYPVHEESAFCVACSNGNAAGNTLEEAILQGFLELVERDAVGLWWYNRLRKRAVALESFDEPYLHQVQAYLRTWSRDLRVLELTSDLGIPAFVAVSRRTDGQSEQIMLGFGAHLDARIGVLRAVTELNQLMAPLLSTAADRTRELLPDDGDPAIRNWLTTARIADHPYLVPDPDQPPMPAPPGLRGSEDLREDVLACQTLVERHGMEMLVLDQTRPDIGLPVVKVIVPGLRHFWPRFAPGRLYQAPVRAGWRPAPLTEEQLNPVMMVL